MSGAAVSDVWLRACRPSISSAAPVISSSSVPARSRAPGRPDRRATTQGSSGAPRAPGRRRAPSSRGTRGRSAATPGGAERRPAPPPSPSRCRASACSRRPCPARGGAASTCSASAHPWNARWTSPATVHRRQPCAQELLRQVRAADDVFDWLAARPPARETRSFSFIGLFSGRRGGGCRYRRRRRG